MRVLIAEDDVFILQGLTKIFVMEGWDVFPASTGTQAVQLFLQHPVDLVCLDVMMPELDGYEVCRRIRQKNTKIPVLFISAKAEEIDRVVGLELGADDFISKPFGVREVMARVHAILRRTSANKSVASVDVFSMGSLTIFPQQLRAQRNQETIDLSPREVKILRLLYDYRGKVVDRNLLLDHCWGDHIMPNSRTVDQQIVQLRKKIEVDARDPQIIRTVHGAGYRYDE